MSVGPRRLPAHFDDDVWEYALNGFARDGRDVATKARRILEADGVALADIIPCAAQGTDGTQLRGCAKLYVPIGGGPPSSRPYAFVLQLIECDDGLQWLFVAFGLSRITGIPQF